MGRPRKEDQTDVTFADAPGLEANQHAKALAKQKSSKKKAKYETFYTVKGTKVIKFTVKPHGVYNEYVGNLSKKKDKEALTQDIAKWKKENVFVQPHEYQEFCSTKIAALTK